MGNILSVLKSIAAAVYSFFKWLLSGDDEHEAKRLVLLGIVVLLILLCIQWCPWFAVPSPPGGDVQVSPVTVNGKPATVVIYRDRLVLQPTEPSTSSTVIGLWPEDKVRIATDGRLSVDRFGLCARPGIGYAVNCDDQGFALSVRLVHYRRWGLSASTWRDSAGTWSAGPSVDTRLPFLRNIRIGLGWSLIGNRGPYAPGTVDLR